MKRNGILAVNRPLYITDSPDQLSPAEIARLKKERSQKVILLVDDDEDMIEIGRKIILGAGYQFLEARNGQECLQVMLERRPSLVLLDLMMPVMNGYDVLKELANNVRYRPVSDIPVIMLTAKMDHHVNRQELFELGLSAFLLKPFGSKELINIIDNVFILDELKRRNRELERKIKQTEYKYQDLIENATDLIFTLNLKGKFVFINRRLMALTGYLRDHWIGKDFRELIVSQDREAAWENFLKTTTGRSRIFEVRIRTKEGKIKYLSINLNPIFEEGKAIGAVAIARDVTKQKKLEQQIKELINFNESIIQSIGSGLMTLDLNNRITSFNSSAEEILGYSSEEVVGKHLEDIFYKEDLERLLPNLNGSEQNLMNRELDLRTKNNRKVHIGFTITPRIDNKNRRVGTIIAFRDISQIKQMQAEVIRMDRLASLGVLASGIAHEIRNPLAGIKTVAQTLEEEIEPGDPKREYLARIIRQVNRMDELLRAFFSYARPRPPVRKFYRLHEIVHEVTALLKQKMEKNNVKFVEEYAPDLPLIFVDFHQIQQVLFNLFINAIDAMPEGGELRLKASQKYTTIQRVDRRRHRFPVPTRSMLYAHVQISDTGVGIRKEDLQKVFDPFFTTKSQGSGLGLSIVYRIIEEHRGDIQVESVEGQGTTFTLLLPAEE